MVSTAHAATGHRPLGDRLSDRWARQSKIMADAIDPQLYASSNPPPNHPNQAYPAQPPTNAAHPYYLSTPALQQPPHLSSVPLAAALDPALEQTSPQGPGAEPDDDEPDDDGDHDGYGGTEQHHDDCAPPLMHAHSAHAAPGAAKAHDDGKRPRACDSCRGLKVRCDQERPDVSCKRCAKAGRPCITTPPTRKRQKKADSRVAELERKIDALTATLHAQKTRTPEARPLGGVAQPHVDNTMGAARSRTLHLSDNAQFGHQWSDAPSDGYTPPPGYGPAQGMPRGPDAKKRKLHGDGYATIPEDMDAIHRDLTDHPGVRRNGKTRVHAADHSHIGPLIDSLMPEHVAERIFLRYVKDICPHFPAVPFLPGTTAAEVRQTKPVLFLAVLAGSPHGSAQPLVSQDVQRELTKLLKDELADIIWRNGEKSLEIVQALQVAVLWYRPPLHFEQHSFYMMVNCAAVMALDLGLGRKATPNVMKQSIGSFRRYHPDSSSIEARRTFLVCYYLCMSITMVLRRPILLRWTKFMEESVKILETSPDALPSDKLLCKQVKMAHIGEDISVQFCMDDPSAEVMISEPKVIYAMKIFENELQQFRDENATSGDMDPTLRLAEHATNLYLHEIALHKDLGNTDLHPPFTEDAVMSSAAGSKQAPIGPAHIGALGECLRSTHGLLDTMLSIELDVLLTLPVIFCVRSIYAVVCLMKMWVFVTSSSEISNIIRKEDLQIETYTEQMVAMFNAIVSRDAQSPHGKFYFVAKRLQERFAQIKEGTTRTEQGNAEDALRQQSSDTNSHLSRQGSTSQTRLHLLSEVAMGSSNTAASQSRQPTAHTRSQQQAQAALQAVHEAQQPTHQNWFTGVSSQPLDATGMPQSTFDLNFDFTQFDLGTGSDADLSALFIPDSMMWGQPVADQNISGYSGF
ncbi:hypothetical protein ACEQ8H_002693 [Pleosporales sp. CAS-2024a]